MHPNYVKIAKDIAASRSFKWMPGMAYWIDNDDGKHKAIERVNSLESSIPANAYPALNDTVTVGALQMLLCKHFDSAPLHFTVRCDNKIVGWEITDNTGRVHRRGLTHYVHSPSPFFVALTDAFYW